jgi:hypothetical protein
MRHGFWRSILALGMGAFVSAAASAQCPCSAGFAGAAASLAPSCCGTGGEARHRAHSAGLIRIGGGCAMPSGCSNLAAERTFLFGSCKQFFNAGSDCAIVHGPRERVAPCTYNTYLNR